MKGRVDALVTAAAAVVAMVGGTAGLAFLPEPFSVMAGVAALGVVGYALWRAGR